MRNYLFTVLFTALFFFGWNHSAQAVEESPDKCQLDSFVQTPFEKRLTKFEFAFMLNQYLELPSDGKVIMKDVSIKHKFYNEMKAMALAGIFKDDRGYYYPNNHITRAFALRTITLAFGLPYEDSNDSKYKDVDGSKFAGQINGLMATGLIETTYPNYVGFFNYIEKAEAECIINYLGQSDIEKQSVTTNITVEKPASPTEDGIEQSFPDVEFTNHENCKLVVYIPATDYRGYACEKENGK